MRERIDLEVVEVTCLICGLSRRDWRVNDGRGFIRGEQPYCCKACADGQGCQCGQDQ